METKWLAYRIFPEPLGTTYQDYDLMNRADVEKLFDYCQILEAMISRQGWQFLINHHSYPVLFEINEGSEWFDCESVEEFIFEVEAHIDSLPI
ncbi:MULTISPECIES: hypothetical protein [Paenibacillus]|uniref:Uncharacterized protein n=1 Tax=Paenibacillus polymyxa (strain SC2) TaxID=886882 RepID=E3EFS9_PAEPS|nr:MULTISPECIES: hypothetical protein [Paenibacillus]ADO55801.1 hypothetical protein PPSC2_08630 [Paenibacillus polymyxa SC2]KAF6582077.1 hypothetical protein G9G57_19195 [Paenibacillus sp. EKM211P]WPQ58527.1 hypothetical protein SKN87_08790 [Paenibacillus polymyxa]CCC84576.1 hypothetical protein PPM_1639 [Paenibacillus polymyxa M1]